MIDDYSLMPQAEFKAEYIADRSGFVQSVDPLTIGICSQHTGAGRQKKEDSIDPSAGVYLMKKTGDPVEKGDVLAVFMGDSEEKVGTALREAESKQAFVIGDEEPEKAPLIKGIVGADN